MTGQNRRRRRRRGREGEGGRGGGGCSLFGKTLKIISGTDST
jgi:hypothetical protein